MALVASPIVAEHGPIATLSQHGRELNVGYREDRDGGAHFDIAVLGGCLADTPIGNMIVTREGRIHSALLPVAEQLGLQPRTESHRDLRHAIEELTNFLNCAAVTRDLGVRLAPGGYRLLRGPRDRVAVMMR